MTSRIIGMTIVALVTVGGSLQARQPAPPPADLLTVINMLKDAAATPAQKQQLAGKIYAGVVLVESVRLSATDQGSAVIDTAPVGQVVDPEAAVIVVMRFTTRADDAQVQSLRRGQTVRVRGTLKDFAVASRGSRTLHTANFADLVIEGPAR